MMARRLFVVLVALYVAALPLESHATAANSWNAAESGSWDNPENWSLGRVPEAGESVEITLDGDYTVDLFVDANIAGLTLGGSSGTQTLNFTSGTLTLTGPGTVAGGGRLQMSGGTLTGGGDLAIESTYDWAGGTITGTGAFEVSSGGTLRLPNGSKTLDGRTLLNNGTVVSLDGTTVLTLLNEAHVDNRAAFNIEGNSNVNLLDEGGGTGARSFENSGTITKSVSGSIVTIQVPFNNTGTVQVDTGILAFSGGGADGGSLNAATGATLRFAGGTHDLDGAALGGAGTIEVFGGTVQTTGTGATVSADSTFLISNSGSFSGAGPMTIDGDFDWTGGTVTGTGGFTLNGGGDWDSGSTITLDGRTLLVSSTGTITWSGGNFDFVNAAVLDNQGNFNIEPGANLLLDDEGGDGSRTFNNSGTLTRQEGGSSSATIDVAFINTGTASADSGSLILTRGGSGSGSYNANGTGVLRFDGGTQILDGATLGGDATVELKTGTLQVITAGATVGASATFLFTNGTLEGDADLTVNGNFDWKGGTITGTGGLVLNGGGTWDGSTHTLDGRTIDIGAAGAITLTAGTVAVSNGGAINNEGQFVIEIGSGLTFDDRGGGATFNNSGSLTKQNGNGLCTMELAFNNSGTVNIDRGELSLTGTGTQTGPFNAGPDGTVHFNSGSYTLDGVMLGGGGLIEVSGPTITTTGGGSTLAAGTSLEFSSGTLDGDGPFTFNGPVEWRGGTITGTGAFTLNEDSVVESFSTKTISERTIDNNATLTWMQGTLRLGSGAVFNNNLNGTVDMQGSHTLDDIGGAPVFNNLGTFSKTTSTGTGNLQPTFNNSGSLNALSGTLRFSGPGNSSHSADITVTASLEFASASHSFDGVTFSGGGTVAMENGTFTTESPGGATVASGTTFIFDGGTINGDGPLIFNGTLDWQSGTFTGTGALTLNSPATFTVSTKVLNGRTLDNNTTVTWTSGTLQMNNGAVFNNNADGTLDIQGNHTLDDTGGNPVFNNVGTFTRSSGTSTTSIEPAFNNSGTLNANAGILRFDGPGATTHSAPINVTATIEFPASSHSFDGVTFDGGGTVLANGGTFTTAGTGGVTIASETSFTLSNGTLDGDGPFTSNGNFTWQGGTVTGTGAFTLNSPSIFNTTTKVLIGRTLDNHSTITWSSGTLQMNNGAIFNNQPGGTLDIQSNLTLDDTGGDPIFNNLGTLTRSAGTGDANFEPDFINTGTLNVNSGFLRFVGPGTSSHTMPINVTATLEFVSATHTLDGVSFNGGGTVLVNGATVTGTGDGITVPSGTAFVLDSGTLNGDGAFTSDGDFNWRGGTITGTGAFTLNSPSVFDDITKVLIGRTLDNHSTISWSSGTLQMNNGAIFNNQSGGTLDIQSNLTLDDTGGDPIFNNLGTLTRSAGAGNANFEPDFINTGTLNVNSGFLRFVGPGTSSHTMPINVAANLEFVSATHTLDGVSFNGGGTVLVNGATVTGTGDGIMVPSGTAFVLDSGTLNGDGTFTSDGDFNWRGGTISGTGAFTLNGPSVFDDTTKMLIGRTLDNHSTITWSSGTLQMNSGAIFNNQSGGTLDIQSNLTLDDTGGAPAFINAGALQKTGGGGTATIEPVFASTGAIDAANGTLRFSEPVTQSGGTVQLTGGDIEPLGGMTIAGGALSGAGSILGDLTVVNSTVRPGASAGLLAIDGDYSQDSSTILELEIGGVIPGTGFDQLAVTGTATLDGTLALALIEAFQPALDTSFDLVTYGARSGKFGTFSASAIAGPGQFLMTDYRADRLTLLVNNGGGIFKPFDSGFNGTDFEVSLLGAEGESYSVEFSADLVTWSPLGAQVISGGTVVFTHPDAANLDQVFYRADLQPGE